MPRTSVRVARDTPEEGSLRVARDPTGAVGLDAPINDMPTNQPSEKTMPPGIGREHML